MLNKRVFTSADKFNFACHRGLACFNTCCQDINIFLTPYDVLQLKDALQISSEYFLEKYALVMETGPQSFPVVMLKMSAPDNKCPFVTNSGCRVYRSRPWSCRIAPVEMRGDDLYGFCFDSSRCHGLKEDQEWTLQQWADNQGIDLEQKLEKRFKDIPRSIKFTGMAHIDKHIKEMFLMACYNLDKFKQYVFDSNFIQVFNVPQKEVVQINNDQIALMQFAFAWLVDGFDIRRSMEIRDEIFT